MSNVVILMFILVGQPPVQLGSFDGMYACHKAIRQILLARIAPSARNNPTVVEAIDTAMLYQQEYQCVPTK